MPLFGDHYDGMTRVAAKGMGIMLHWKYMTEDDLYAALTSVITDSRLDFCTTGTRGFMTDAMFHTSRVKYLMSTWETDH